MKTVRRGYHEEDRQLFGEEAKAALSICADDITYLLNRGYPYKSALTFVGNHYLLAERQRNALMRICASDAMLKLRRERQLSSLEKGCTVHIDAFNAVVLMETALSGSMLLQGRDGCYRDLSGLAGTYSVIDKTDAAIGHIIRKLQEHDTAKAVFWIDAPVSNSGRLKQHIAEAAERLSFAIDIRMVRDADAELKVQENVISGDSIVISECLSWYNLYEELISELPEKWVFRV